MQSLNSCLGPLLTGLTRARSALGFLNNVPHFLCIITISDHNISSLNQPGTPDSTLQLLTICFWNFKLSLLSLTTSLQTCEKPQISSKQAEWPLFPTFSNQTSVCISHTVLACHIPAHLLINVAILIIVSEDHKRSVPHYIY
jgi:hypothetical protein